MQGTLVQVPEAGVSGHLLKRIVTEQVRILLEHRSIRLAALGSMLVIASAFALIPTPLGIDSGWMFIVPVAIAAIAAGLKEGLGVAFAASALCALFAAARTGHAELDHIAGVVLARFMLYGLTAAVLGSFAEAHYAVQSNLRQLATLDPLTKVANVARFYEELGVLEKMSTDFAVMVVDVDELKVLNDKFGHQAGSAAIQTVAQCLQRVVRGSDCVARYGGDEFVVILKGADRGGAQIVGNRLRQILAAEENPYAPGTSPAVSIGVALFGEDGTTSEELLASADAAMYADKRSRKVVRL